MEERELLLQKLEKDLKDTCRERDKAVQELTRLKQHLLEKVVIYHLISPCNFPWSVFFALGDSVLLFIGLAYSSRFTYSTLIEFQICWTIG